MERYAGFLIGNDPAADSRSAQWPSSTIVLHPLFKRAPERIDAEDGCRLFAKGRFISSTMSESLNN